jgi:hypothetical protein
MFSIRSLITLILVSLLVSVGCNGNKDATKVSSKGTETEKKETKPTEPKGPGGSEMK